MTLIVVESPTKARTFNRILKDKGGNYEVFATVGHFRDIPAGSLNIDYTQNFKPTYEVSAEKQKVVQKLLELVTKHNHDVILATDEDREGESITYHIAYVLGYLEEKWPDFVFTRDLKRIVFHEITPKALFEALENPTQIRTNLVKAQQARRILDRVVGYELSPLLWKKLGKNWLSAGRVQTVGLRIIVEREKEIKSFAQEQYFQFTGVFALGDAHGVKAKLLSQNNVPFESKTQISLFAGDYEYTKTTIDSAKRDHILRDLQEGSYQISHVDVSESSKYPPPPYTTSLLQIDAYQKLRYPSKLTMKLAQTLYERGLITYHRTDSFNLSGNFVFKAKDYIAKTYGSEYTLDKPRGFKTKSKGAQQAHEAIRPTKFEKHPKTSKGKRLSGELLKLYSLIFNRAIACQMAEAKMKIGVCHITHSQGYLFEKVSEQVVFDGFLAVLNPTYVERHRELPTYTTQTPVALEKIESEEHFSKAPPRYNDGSLVRILEEKGIGRPSTYASIISNIQDRQYVVRDKNYFVPTSLGTAISDYLSNAFPTLFDLNFTAQMEERLDHIEAEQENLVDVLTNFYAPFKKELDEKKTDTTTLEVKQDLLDETCPECGKNLMYRYGKYGKFTACSGFPTCKFIKKTYKYLEGEVCPQCGGKIIIRYSLKTRKRFYGCENYPTCKYARFTMKAPNPQSP